MLLLKVLFVIAVSCYCSGSRVKRVFQGTRVLGRKGPYDAVRYMVGIGTMHGVPFYTLGFHDWSLLKKIGVYGNIACGGVLLTPNVIETACHCVAQFAVFPYNRQARINHHWENVRVNYIGINDRFGEPFSMLTRPPVPSLKFFVHKLCEKLPKTTQQAITHDFGLVKIDPTWIKGNIRVPTTNVRFAPMYKVDEITKIYLTFLRNPPVCLNLGFGVFSDYGATSDYIRAGWTHLVIYYWCQKYSCYNMTWQDIKKYKSWVCGEEFPNHYQPVMSGDSGSPFTCNNVLFGLVSSSLKQKDIYTNKERRIGMYSTLKFSLYANAIEYRDAFEKDINDWSKDIYVDIVREILRHYVPFPILRRIRHGHSKSQSTSSVPLRFIHEKASESSSNSIHVPSGLLLLLVALSIVHDRL